MSDQPLYQDGRGKWLMPWDGPIVSAIGIGRDAAAITQPAPSQGVYEIDRFFERAAISFPPPDGARYRSTLLDIGRIGTDGSSIAFPPPDSGSYISTIKNIGRVATDDISLGFPPPALGAYQETLVPLGELTTDTVAIEFPHPSQGAYALP